MPRAASRSKRCSSQHHTARQQQLYASQPHNADSKPAQTPPEPSHAPPRPHRDLQIPAKQVIRHRKGVWLYINTYHVRLKHLPCNGQHDGARRRRTPTPCHDLQLSWPHEPVEPRSTERSIQRVVWKPWQQFLIIVHKPSLGIQRRTFSLQD